MVYLAHIRTAFALSNGTCGSPRMHRELVDEGYEIGRHRTAHLMHENQLIARHKRRFKRTTDSEHAWSVAPKLVARDFTADGPDRKWGADISQIWRAMGWLYLAVVLDRFSLRVAGWAPHCNGAAVSAPPLAQVRRRRLRSGSDLRAPQPEGCIGKAALPGAERGTLDQEVVKPPGDGVGIEGQRFAAPGQRVNRRPAGPGAGPQCRRHAMGRQRIECRRGIAHRRPAGPVRQRSGRWIEPGGAGT